MRKIIGVLCALSLLTACAGKGSAPTGDRGMAINPGRLRITDAAGRPQPPTILETQSCEKLHVSLDGHDLSGHSRFCEDLQLTRQLSAMLSTKLDGQFIKLPWSRGSAYVGGYSAITVPGSRGTIFICGGDESPNNVRFSADKTWLVDPNSGSSCGPTMRWPRKGAVLTALSDGRILICGGHWGENDKTITPELEVYDPGNETIKRAGSLTVPRDRVTAVELANKKILIVGGETRPQADPPLPLGQAQADAELYDPLTGKSTHLGPVKAPQVTTWTAPVGPDRALIAGYSQLVPGSQARLGETVIINAELPPTPNP
ncbi:MAG: hypothetical protein JSS83_12370 [Cyanobacteria bacterium SZAS LIN-3]|nr:hypothetical protein [Cyanobacteria bacterium SZAS LIN-3]MBS2008997.1 hypothetical protein [Cyanobacteria bacterium SZAS TMP-1]